VSSQGFAALRSNTHFWVNPTDMHSDSDSDGYSRPWRLLNILDLITRHAGKLLIYNAFIDSYKLSAT
jgi:hypothetical protein